MQENLNTSFALSISHSSFLPCLCPIFSAQNASPCPFITLFIYFKSDLHSEVLQKFFLHISPRWYDVLFFPANPHNTCHLSYCLAALPSITVIRLDIAYQTRGFLRADTLYHSPHRSCLALLTARAWYILWSWMGLNLPVGTRQMAPCRNDSQAVLLQRPLVSAKTQSPCTDDSSSFQKVKEDLVPSDQSKLRPFCGGKSSHHFLTKTAGGITQHCVSISDFAYRFLFPLLTLLFQGSGTAGEHGLTKRNICHRRFLF